MTDMLLSLVLFFFAAGVMFVLYSLTTHLIMALIEWTFKR